MPPGIYLDALKLGMEGLAREMNDIINHQQRYHDFFKWHNYYSFHDTSADGFRDSICAFCDFLNNGISEYKSIVYNNILKWWNVPKPDEFPNTPHSTYTEQTSSTQVIMPVETLPTENEKINLNSVFSNIFDYIFNGE